MIIITHHGLPQRILTFSLTVKLKCLCLEPCPPIEVKKEEINTSSCLRLAILGDTCKIRWTFYFVSSPPSLIHKRTCHSDPQKMVSFRHSLPFMSADFPYKVIFLISTPHLSGSLAFHAVSRVSLDSVIISSISKWLQKNLSTLVVKRSGIPHLVFPFLLDFPQITRKLR